MNKLKAVRMSLGLTQPQVSEELKKVEPHADVGVISRYENGVCLPTPAQMVVLETILKTDRGQLYDIEDIDLPKIQVVYFKPAPSKEQIKLLCGMDISGLPESDMADSLKFAPQEHGDAIQTRKRKPETKYRKCFRIPRPFAESLPPDLLAVCGHSSWQSWFDAAMKRLLAEYAARKKYTDRKESGS